ncbi:MAG: 5-bromo-4-chloroindolyl phosphate hydrolysis family protein [Pseudomonadota bacterium]
MKSVRWANRLALLAALGVLIFAFGYLRLRGLTPVFGAAIVYLSMLWTLWPRNTPVIAVLPDGMTREDLDRIDARLRAAGNRLADYAADVGAYDAVNFREMAKLINAIRQHVRRNPMHLVHTRQFFRHTLDSMIGLVADYTELIRRDLPEHRDRLTRLSAQFDAFIPALERVERACVENDLTALEVSIDVLNQQMTRRA